MRFIFQKYSSDGYQTHTKVYFFGKYAIEKKLSPVRSRMRGRSGLRKGSIKKSCNERALKEVLRTKLMASAGYLKSYEKIIFFYIWADPY